MAKKEDQRAALEAELVAKGYAQAVATPEGRAMLREIIEDYGRLHRLSITGQTPPLTEFHEGCRSVGLRVLENVMAADWGAYHRMSKERAQRAAIDERQRDRNRREQFGGGDGNDAGDGND